jgi:hypothetical protein
LGLIGHVRLERTEERGGVSRAKVKLVETGTTAFSGGRHGQNRCRSG